MPIWETTGNLFLNRPPPAERATTAPQAPSAPPGTPDEPSRVDFKRLSLDQLRNHQRGFIEASSIDKHGGVKADHIHTASHGAYTVEVEVHDLRLRLTEAGRQTLKACNEGRRKAHLAGIEHNVPQMRSGEKGFVPASAVGRDGRITTDHIEVEAREAAVIEVVKTGGELCLTDSGRQTLRRGRAMDEFESVARRATPVDIIQTRSACEETRPEAISARRLAEGERGFIVPWKVNKRGAVMTDQVQRRISGTVCVEVEKVGGELRLTKEGRKIWTEHRDAERRERLSRVEHNVPQMREGEKGYVTPWSVDFGKVETDHVEFAPGGTVTIEVVKRDGRLELTERGRQSLKKSDPYER